MPSNVRARPSRFWPLLHRPPPLLLDVPPQARLRTGQLFPVTFGPNRNQAWLRASRVALSSAEKKPQHGTSGSLLACIETTWSWRLYRHLSSQSFAPSSPSSSAVSLSIVGLSLVDPPLLATTASAGALFANTWTYCSHKRGSFYWKPHSRGFRLSFFVLTLNLIY